MNRNRKRSEKKDQKRIRDSHNASEKFKVVTYPNYEKHIFKK